MSKYSCNVQVTPKGVLSKNPGLKLVDVRNECSRDSIIYSANMKSQLIRCNLVDSPTVSVMRFACEFMITTTKCEKTSFTAEEDKNGEF